MARKRKNKIRDNPRDNGFDKEMIEMIHHEAHFMDRGELDKEYCKTGSQILRNLSTHHDYAITFKVGPKGIDNDYVPRNGEVEYITIKRATSDIIPTLLRFLSGNNTIMRTYATQLEREELSGKRRIA